MALDWKSVYAKMHAGGEALFPPAALHYLLQLNRQASQSRNSSPVTPKELVEDFRRQTRRDFGPMLKRVLEDWELTAPVDLGRAVVLLGRYGCLTLEADDTVDAFAALGTDL